LFVYLLIKTAYTKHLAFRFQARTAFCVGLFIRKKKGYVNNKFENFFKNYKSFHFFHYFQPFWRYQSL